MMPKYIRDQFRTLSIIILLFASVLVGLSCIFDHSDAYNAEAIAVSSFVSEEPQNSDCPRTIIEVQSVPNGNNASGIQASIDEEDYPIISQKEYSDDDLDLLSRLINAEAGSEWIPDLVQLYVGSVVINRMKSDLYPDSLYDVIYQDGQYSPVMDGSINNTPDKRTVENARRLLDEGSILPANVVFQANFVQGDGIFYEYYDEYLGTTTYFCYLERH